MILKDKIPHGLKTVLEEKATRLSRRCFTFTSSCMTSINSRLTKRANVKLDDITIATSKKGLV